MSRTPFDPRLIYVGLDADGSATTMPGGDAFWSQPGSIIDAVGAGWLVSEFEFSADWPTWEMHPYGDELVYVLSGDVELLLEQEGGVVRTAIRGRGALVVPRGVWHTAKVRAPSRTLHVTLGRDTQTRPASRADDATPAATSASHA